MSTAAFLEDQDFFQILSLNFQKCYFEGNTDVHLRMFGSKPVLNRDNCEV